MQLIGMMDSPYVRRVAISLAVVGLPFEHRPLSVFDGFNEFARINPVVKAPTLIANDGTVLMDSTLILEHLQDVAGPERSLMPTDTRARTSALRLIALALAACEKTVQIVYERNLRPVEKRHQPWLDRIQTQLSGAYRLLEQEMCNANPWLVSDRMMQADITVAVAWRFTQFVLPEVVSRDRHPTLRAFSERIEGRPEFLAAPLV